MIAVSIDGELVAPERAAISVFDRGLLYGDGVFEILRARRGVAIDLDAHLDRMLESAHALALHAPERDRLAATIAATGAACGADDARVRVIITRGAGPIGARLAALGPGRTIVIAEPTGELPREIALAIVDWPLPRRRGAGRKTLAYLDHVIARELAAAAGADEAVRLDADGCVAECATANVFVVAGGAVATPSVDRGALPGVARARVLAICARLAIAACERTIAPDELAAADELFVTSAIRGVVPVVRLDGVVRTVGPLTRQISAAFDAGR